jgi:hypothetical protein
MMVHWASGRLTAGPPPRPSVRRSAVTLMGGAMSRMKIIEVADVDPLCWTDC